MAESVPNAVQSCHELLLWIIIPHLDKFLLLGGVFIPSITFIITNPLNINPFKGRGIHSIRNI